MSRPKPCGWHFSYAKPSACNGWLAWILFHNAYYYARGVRCVFTRIFGVEIEHIHPYGT